jgi:glycosyltransferase involved in cell wall biosynthesis
MKLKKFVLFRILEVIEIVLIIPFWVISYASRFCTRRIDVGLGPEPLINNVYHKRALMEHGYRAETFVSDVYFITEEFDFSLHGWRRHPITAVLVPFLLFLRCLFRYRCLFIYFHGGPLWHTRILSHLEAYFYKAAGIKTVVMPYGSDVQVLTRSKNLYFKHAMSIDYPTMRDQRGRIGSRIDRWTRHADWIISGCEWVDYMYYWNTLLLGHFSIDLERWSTINNRPEPKKTDTFRILHAPNHTTIKGTTALVDVVEALKREGLRIELVLMKNVPNTEIRRVMENVDLVADQFVIGWYAMFAIEAMAMKKPVLCYLREDLIDLYTKAGLLVPDEIPLVNTSLVQIEDRVKWAYSHREELASLGEKGREFVKKHHSTETIGRVFAEILKSIELLPS